MREVGSEMCEGGLSPMFHSSFFSAMKTFLLLAACCLCMWRTATAQASWQWATTASGFTVNDVVTDASGEALVTGVFNAPVSFYSPYFAATLTPVGTSDIILVRYDVSGNVKWAKQVGGSGATAVGISLALDGAGYGFLAGSYANAALTANTGGTPIGYTGGSLGTVRTCVLRFVAATGVVAWGQGMGGGNISSRNCIPTDVAATGSGTCFVTGMYGAYAQFPGAVLSSSLKQTVYAAAFAANGSLTWAKSSNPVAFSYYASQANGNGIASDGAGNCYLTGSYSYSDFQLGGLQLPTADASQSFVARLNPATGQAVWLKGTTTATAPASAQGHHIAVAGTSCYVGGSFSGTIAFGGLYTLLAPDSRGYLASYTTAAGATNWVRPLLDATGLVKVAASTTSVVAAGAMKPVGATAAHGKLWLYAPSGVSQGSAAITGGSSGASSGINGLGYAGTVLHVGGPFTGTCIFGSSGLGAFETGPPAHYLARLNVASTRGTAATARVLSAYPNPAVDIVRLTLPAAVRTADLYNAQGQVVRQLHVMGKQSEVTLSVQGLRPGPYWLHWRTEAEEGRYPIQVQP